MGPYLFCAKESLKRVPRSWLVPKVGLAWLDPLEQIPGLGLVPKVGLAWLDLAWLGST